MTGRRRGRPQQMPDDPSSLRSRTFGAWPRSAWLLATSRMLGTDLELASRSAFVERLKGLGLAADLSRVSRWESGQQAVPTKVVLAYEGALGLPSGSILATSRSLLRNSAPTPPPPERATYGEEDKGLQLVQGLLERALAGDALCGGEWLQLTVELARFDYFFLMADSWQVLCGRLVNELSRTMGIDHLRRYEACVTLIGHDIARPHMLHALGSWLTHPDVQLAAPAVSLLREIPEAPAGELVLRLLRSDNPTLREAAVGVAAGKAARGHFDTLSLRKLEKVAARRLDSHETTRAAVDTIDLVAHLPDDGFERVMRGLRDPAKRPRLQLTRDKGLLLPAQHINVLCRTIAGQAQAITPTARPAEPDALLEKLVKELLFHVHGVRRRMAGRVLALSPYGPAVADACVPLAGGVNEVLAARAWDSLLVLGHGNRRDEVVALAVGEPRTGLQGEALVSVGLGRRHLDEDEAEKLLAVARETPHADVRASAVFALGMAGPGHIADAGRASEESARAARWWAATGPAIYDADSSPGPAATAL